MTDIDDQLRAYAERWRTAQPPPPSPVLGTQSAQPRFARFEHPARLAAIAATVAVVVAGVAAFAVTRHSPSTRVSTANGRDGPVATPPLIFSSQPPPRFITLTVGRARGIQWKFTAGYLPTETPTGLGPGLCLEFDTTAGSGSAVLGCDNPATTPSLTANVVPLKGDPSMLLIAGVTSAPAATFTVTVGNVSLTTPALTTPALGGLRFYAVPVPAADYQRSHRVAVEAVSANRSGLLRNDPSRTATLQSHPAGRTSAGLTETCGPAKNFSNGSLNFSYSGCWTAVTYDEVSSFSASIVYLSDQQTHQPCHAIPNGRECGWPIDRLQPGHILVEWATNGFPGWTLSKLQGSPTTVGGQPARVNESQPGQCSSIGSDTTITAAIVRETPDNWYSMTACLLDPGDTQAAIAVHQMLSSVTFTGPA